MLFVSGVLVGVKLIVGVMDGVTLTVGVGVIDIEGVVLGVIDGVTDGVTEIVGVIDIDGVTLGVTEGVIDIDGVIDGVLDGVTDGVFDGAPIFYNLNYSSINTTCVYDIGALVVDVYPGNPINHGFSVVVNLTTRVYSRCSSYNAILPL